MPLRESHLLSRYVGLSKQSPKLGKPGSGQWEKIRAKAEQAALDYAAELLRFQATREIETGGITLARIIHGNKSSNKPSLFERPLTK